ncbi:MAG: DegT/DnrJ/EryC1/StrS family aminotransferase [Sphingomonadales bacterium]|nr:DegT/DnrJ/EryC1/StrS family aminotransferase [Sphingomonadales bacterium]
MAALEQPFNSGQLASGSSVSRIEQYFEERFAGYHAVATSDMTNALALALRLANIGNGSEVMTLAFNCMSSNAAVAMAGARPVWIDVNPETASFDVEHARSQLSSRTKAVIVYHLAGYPADMARIRKFCDEHGLILIEDANNAFGAEFSSRPIGTFGDFTVFSFYANRQINAIDGGLLLCRRPYDAERARRLRRFGVDHARFRDADGEIDPASDVPEIGGSSTLNNINATLALVSLADVDARITRSRENIEVLCKATSGSRLTPIKPLTEGKPAYWTWLARLADRETVMQALKSRGVKCSKLHHPNHHYSGFGVPGAELPGTDLLAREMLAIPCGWWIDQAHIPQLATAIRDALQATS